ncbi:type II toxin-antitoxin system VapC family toxin [Rhodocaloribacter litoris]|uniref:type II toxin-antitoxin system VapC family toxin n=1 Tax=Rhodocaloribacter litoris TaxID=2558931 RepID=UPI001E38E987|nr:type II toxin-antitoxin system VapC family toxin [Rhodocaloribacter litoris]
MAFGQRHRPGHRNPARSSGGSRRDAHDRSGRQSLGLSVEGAHTSEVRKLFQHDPEWIVPPLWESEFLNVMWRYIRQNTFSVDDALRRFRAARGLVRIVDTPPAELVLRLASDHDLTAYDATYAALGRHLGVPHVTYDRQVIAAGLGIHPRDFSDG